MEARRYARIGGLGAALLFAAGNAIWALGFPPGGTPVVEIVSFYEERAERIIIGASLSLLAIGAFVVFAAALRQVLLDAGAEDWLATAGFGGALLGMAAGLGAESINMIGGLRASEDALTPELAHAVYEIPQVLGSFASALGLGVFAVATGFAALRTGVLARPLALTVAGAGVLLLTPLSYLNAVAGAVMIGVSLLIAAGLRPGSSAAP